MEIAALTIIASMVWTVVAFLKHLTNRKFNDAVTLAVIVGVGIAVTFLVRASDFGDVVLSGHALKNLNAAGTVVIGYAATSLLRAGYEFKKAIDHSDSAAEAKLLPPS